MLRWFIFLVIVLFIDFYAFQSIKTITKNKIVFITYWVLSIAVIVNIVYSINSIGESRGLSQQVMLAFGLLILILTPKIVALLVLFGEDIFRVFKTGFNYFGSSKTTEFFPGGAQADEEYIWLKDYLQLDGMTYKLVPIYTKNEGNFFEMGRINSDVMYENVKNWDWRNITDDNIYLDTETRKNSVTYRNNMERLARTLINENKPEKAEEILDLSLEKMPVKKFGHYSMLISYIDLYYALDKKEKARKLISELKIPLQENLEYFSQYEESNIDIVFDQIERNFLMYDQIVKTTIRFDDDEYAEKIKNEYVVFLKLFDFLMADQE